MDEREWVRRGVYVDKRMCMNISWFFFCRRGGVTRWSGVCWGVSFVLWACGMCLILLVLVCGFVMVVVWLLLVVCGCLLVFVVVFTCFCLFLVDQVLVVVVVRCFSLFWSTGVWLFF